jgi:hypothetical protein
MKRTALIVLLFAPGCLAKQLRTPAQDHYVQAKHIATSCAGGTYGTCSPDLVEDLEAMAKQACLLDAIAQGNDGSQCSEPEGDK